MIETITTRATGHLLTLQTATTLVWPELDSKPAKDKLMHSKIKTGDFALIHYPTGERTRTIVSYSGDVYFTCGDTRYRKTTGLPIWISGPYSVATPDEEKEDEPSE